jgi:norsolorinic acid ketoreductase
MIAFRIHSFVQTDMGDSAARKLGLEKAFFEVDEVVRGMVSVIDDATREKTSGHFPIWSGGDFPW